MKCMKSKKIFAKFLFVAKIKKKKREEKIHDESLKYLN